MDDPGEAGAGAGGRVDWLHEVRAYNVHRAAVDPARAALLVIDMQRFFAGVTPPVVGNVCALVDAARRRGVPVLFTRHGHRDLAVDGGLLAEWWETLAVYGSDEWQLLPELEPRAGEPVLDKIRYSAFFGTPLDTLLRAQGVEQLIVTGVMTNCCCETTAREAMMRDYRVFFDADATNTEHAELHLASLRNLAYAFAHIVDTAQVLEALG